MKKLKVLAGRVVFILVMLFGIIAFILYKQGYYDIIFIKRDTEPVSSNIDVPEETTIETTSIPETESTETEPAEEVTDKPVTPVQSSVAEPTYKDLTAKIESSRKYIGSGWEISEAIYNRNTHKIVSFTMPVETANTYSYRNEAVQTQQYNEISGTTEVIEKIQQLPQVRSYMGYLLINNRDNTTSLYDPIKNIISRNMTDLSPANLRDVSGNPVFNYNGAYHIMGTDNRLTSDNVDTSITPGLQGNYTSYYGTPQSGLYMYYDERVVSTLVNAAQVTAALSRGEEITPRYVDQKVKTFGYKNQNGSIVIPAKYQYAYNFSDNGYAVVADQTRSISVINTSGNVTVSRRGTTLNMPELSSRLLYDGYYLPKDFTMDQRGMLYFDHGLLRVRRVITETNTMASILKDYDLLIKPDGTVFDIPAGYEIAYYSDGVAVLKKGVYYGCFSYTGKWITQPIYTYASMFNEGLAVLGTADGKKGVVDTDGNTVLPFIYDEISEISGGIITAYEKQNGWSVYFKIAKEG